MIEKVMAPRLITILLLAEFLIGCQTLGSESGILNDNRLTFPKSYLAEKENPDSAEGETPKEFKEVEEREPNFEALEPISRTSAYQPSSQNLSKGLPDEGSISVATETMPVRDFIHYVFGELLGLSYVIDSQITGSDPTLTLNAQEPLSPKRLFSLSLQLLTDSGIKAMGNDGILYFRKGEDQGQTVIGIGRTEKDIPNTSQNILQVVPVTYGAKLSTERTLSQLTRARVLTDLDQNAYFVIGGRNDVLQAVELINLLDSPANRGRYIGLIRLTYLDTQTFETQLQRLLSTEGIEIGVAEAQRTPGSQSNVVLVPLERISTTVIFATSELLLDRVTYWANILDKPSKGTGKRYFTYTPQNARAADIYESLAGLYGQGASRAAAPQAASQTEGNSVNTGQAPQGGRSQRLQTDELSVVVDERSNTLILYCSGTTFQTLSPLIKKLDILPKQVLLDIMIAEVSLKDEFRLGVEWALRRNGVDYSTQGAFGASSFAGLALLVNENAGVLNAKALATNSLVNIISNPSLLVRDGVTASIEVGSDISVIGNTTLDPLLGQRQTVASEYRKTGVNVSITPTVNAEDVVIMEVSQSISNSVPGSTGAAGNPDIFERSLETEVISRSGQTVLLGGLISQDKSTSNQGIPFISRLPLIGALGKGQSRSSQKTELIMLITPRVLDDTSELDDVRKAFSKSIGSGQ